MEQMIGLGSSPCACSPFQDAPHPLAGNTLLQKLPEMQENRFAWWVLSSVSRAQAWDLHSTLLLFFLRVSRPLFKGLNLLCQAIPARETHERNHQKRLRWTVYQPLPLWKEPNAKWSSPMPISHSSPQSRPNPSSLYLTPPSRLLTFPNHTHTTTRTTTE